MPAQHELHASPETVHWGFFDASLPPVLRLDSGDRVTIHCLSGEPEDLPPGPFEVLPEHREVLAKCERGPGPHLMTGPVWVNGAEPGDALEVRILDCTLRQDWGWNLIMPLLGTLPEDFPKLRRIHIPLDREAMVADLPWGGRLPLSPFFGILGVAPPANYGRIPSFQPREHGGNMDNKDLVAGTTLYLPIWNKGALFSAGDGHGVQGDGEVCLTAIETCMTGTFDLIVRKDLSLRIPRAESPTHYITMGFDPDLDDAAERALREMISLLAETAGLSPEDAYTLCSLAADLRVTQLVDGNKGIHAVLPKAIFSD
ncbi:MAG: acetamidase/formamidase family protein [Nitrospinota bacterium]